MGDNPAQTLSEIEASRQRLESDIDVLAARLPQKDVLADQAKLYGGAAAGAGVGLIALVVAMKKRSATKDRQRQARETAEALAEIMDVIPVEAHARVEHASSRTGPVALVAALVGIALAVVNARRAR
ncbi:MAG: hypothetical protein KY461_07300 [Actinobacteria bacterium]|nr:hypothetical protein [Actinomycetota bacterium]